MKKIFILPSIIALCFSIIGCGKKDDTNVNGTNDNTKVTTITESYEKYVELKENAYDKMSEKLTEKNQC